MMQKKKGKYTRRMCLHCDTETAALLERMAISEKTNPERDYSPDAEERDAGRRVEKWLKELDGAEQLHMDEIRKYKAAVREADAARRQLVERSLRFA